MRIFKDESGQSIVIVAAFMGLVAMGFLAFALDVGTLSQQKRMAQAAADAAALAAAEEVSVGASSNEQTAANAMAKLNGFDTTLATNPATVTLSTPNSGNYSGSAYVKATVSRPIPTMFLRALRSNWATMDVSASSIAGGSQTSQTCICLEGTSGEVLNMSNNAKLNAASCGLVDNSTSSNALGIVGSATLTSVSLGTVSSTWNNASNYSSNVNNGGSIANSTTIVTGITSSCAPTLPTAPAYSSCVNDPGGAWGTFTWGPASASSVICYNALTVGSNGSTCTLNPGTYVINGGELHFESGANNHSNLGGNGVFFYLVGNASLVIDNGANVNLVAGGATQNGGGTAPTVGTYNGIAVYQATSDTQTVQIQGGSTTFMNGAIYAPGANINAANGSGSTIEGGIVAKSLTMAGGAILNATTDINEGSLSVGSPKLLQ
jgi:Flp pilus assembly protein TadG